jgi:putative restriction endonuclease
MESPIADIETLNYYAKKFQRLRVDRAHGVAPHKPILLLAVIERFERGQMLENRINLSPELNQTFLKYWSYLGRLTITQIFRGLTFT